MDDEHMRLMEKFDTTLLPEAPCNVTTQVYYLKEKGHSTRRYILLFLGTFLLRKLDLSEHLTKQKILSQIFVLDCVPLNSAKD